MQGLPTLSSVTWSLVHCRLSVDMMLGLGRVQGQGGDPQHATAQEPFCRPFLGQNRFWLLFYHRVTFQNAIGKFFRLTLLFCGLLVSPVLQLNGFCWLYLLKSTKNGFLGNAIHHFCGPSCLPFDLCQKREANNDVDSVVPNKLQIANCTSLRPPVGRGWEEGVGGVKNLVLSPLSLARSAAGVASWFCCDTGCLLYRFVPMPPWKSLTWRLRSLDWTTLSSSTSPDLIATNLCGKLVLPLNAFYYVHVHGLISLLCRTYAEIQDEVFWCLLLEK